jgi:hypothetical protein
MERGLPEDRPRGFVEGQEFNQRQGPDGGRFNSSDRTG